MTLELKEDDKYDPIKLYLNDKFDLLCFLNRKYDTDIKNSKAIHNLFWYEFDYKQTKINLVRYRISTIIGNFRNSKVNLNTMIGINILHDDYCLYN
jgi:hypothetical protein